MASPRQTRVERLAWRLYNAEDIRRDRDLRRNRIRASRRPCPDRHDSSVRRRRAAASDAMAPAKDSMKKAKKHMAKKAKKATDTMAPAAPAAPAQ